MVPKIEVQVAGSFRSLPGQIGPPALPPNNDVQVAFTATNAFLATNSTLGRPLAGGTPSVNLQLLEPYTSISIAATSSTCGSARSSASPGSGPC